MTQAIDVKKIAEQAGAIRIHERPKELALCGNKEIEAFAALVLEAAAVECDEEHNRARFNMDCDVAANYRFWQGGAIFSDQLAEAIRAMKPGKEQG